MNDNVNRKGTLLLAILAAAALLPFAPRAAATDSPPVTFTVTAVDNHNSMPPDLKRNDVHLYRGKEQIQIADWKRSEDLNLAILIDDSLESSVANQWPDLRAFIMAQPATTRIAVAYGRNGAAMIAQDFTTDHALAAKALRLPTGDSGAFTSPYLELQDWIKRWPESHGRNSILLFSSGVDYFRGGFEPLDPDLETTVEHAQKKNINIWSIYIPDAGHLGRRPFRAFNAQSNLSQMSEESGGEAYYLGFAMPVTLKPYFDEIQRHLDNQYLLSFVGNGGPKGKFETMRSTTEVPSVQIMTPSQVFVPAGQ